MTMSPDLSDRSCDPHPTQPNFSINPLFRMAYVTDPNITLLLRLGILTSQLHLVGILTEEVLEHQCYISKVLVQLPSVLLHQVSQPLYQVLHPLPNFLDIEDHLDFILQVVIFDCGRRWWWRILRGERRG